MNKDKKDKLRHKLLMFFSSSYKENYESEKAERIWEKVTDGLPEPTGIPDKDCERISQFSQKVKSLSPKEHNLLEKWLYARLAFLEDRPDEDVSSRILKYEHKWEQIYRMHLSVM